MILNYETEQDCILPESELIPQQQSLALFPSPLSHHKCINPFLSFFQLGVEGCEHGVEQVGVRRC